MFSFHPHSGVLPGGPFGELILVMDLDIVREVGVKLEEGMLPSYKTWALRVGSVIFFS